MGIVVSKSDHTPSGGVVNVELMPPSVDGAVRLTPMQMNMLHFGSDKKTLRQDGGQKGSGDSKE